MKNKRKILIVDDFKINRQILTKILADDYDTIEANNGQQALDVLCRNRGHISLILLDTVMPIMDGYEFLSICSGDPILSTIPIVVTAQITSAKKEVEILKSGATDFITKPYNPTLIKHRVASIINLQENVSIFNLMQYDHLTGVYGKELFYNKARQFIDCNNSSKLDIICSKMVNFNLIKEYLSKQTFDKLIRCDAQNHLDMIDNIGVCGRIGIDTFAIITKRRLDYSKLFGTYIEKLNNEFEHYKLDLKFGIYQIHDNSVPVSKMCDRALLALECIINKYSEHYVFYDDEIRRKRYEEQLIISSMDKALAKKQFVVYLQPKYNIIENKVSGAEALVRWIHPNLGLILPDKFVPTFEKNGSIIELDKYVWEKTCKILSKWEKEGINNIPISVNVSREDLFNPDLVDILLELINKYNILQENIHLEITESAYSNQSDKIITAVKKLKCNGFTIEMDDFGTGYSSLNMLSELPIDFLKLDIKFIQNKKENSNSITILDFIISLANKLNMPVIVEGVETEEQLNLLKEMGCQYVQGYYFSKPVPVNEFEKHLKEHEVCSYIHT